MKKIIHFEAQLPLTIFKEGKTFVAYSPAIDLATSGKDFDEVNKRFGEILKIFIEELIKKGTLEQVLEENGWTKTNKQWSPPTFIAHKNIPVKV